MRRLIFITLMMSCLWVQAGTQAPLLVAHPFENLRIVLATELECNIPGLSGKRASAQRLDGLYVPGCWYEDPTNADLWRIDWHNGDFSALPKDSFEPVELNNH